MNIRHLDPTTRKHIVIANACLVNGLVLILFLHPSGTGPQCVVHALSGFLLGLSATINIFALIRARRCRA
jgi:hypothetical protein